MGQNKSIGIQNSKTEYAINQDKKNKEHLFTGQILRDLTAAIFGNWIGTYVGHPLDTVKIRMQLSYSNESMFTIANNILRREGFSGFYKGACSPLVGNIFIWSSAFVANDFSKRALSRFDISQNANNFWSGVFSGIVGSYFTTPIEFLKIKKQVDIHSNLRYSQIVSSEGVRGVFSGLHATLMRDVPGWWVYFYSYSSLKLSIGRLVGLEQDAANRHAYKAMFVNLMAGGFAGQISWVVTYPMDIVKSYIQNHPDKPSIINAVKHMYRMHGIHFMTKGLIPCLINGFVSNSIVFVLYEYSLEMLNNLSHE